MNDLTLGDFGRYADLYRPRKDSSETLCIPALTDTGQRRTGASCRRKPINQRIAMFT